MARYIVLTPPLPAAVENAIQLTIAANANRWLHWFPGSWLVVDNLNRNAGDWQTIVQVTYQGPVAIVEAGDDWFSLLPPGPAQWFQNHWHD